MMTKPGENTITGQEHTWCPGGPAAWWRRGALPPAAPPRGSSDHCCCYWCSQASCGRGGRAVSHLLGVGRTVTRGRVPGLNVGGVMVGVAYVLRLVSWGDYVHLVGEALLTGVSRVRLYLGLKVQYVLCLRCGGNVMFFFIVIIRKRLSLN